MRAAAWFAAAWLAAALLTSCATSPPRAPLDSLHKPIATRIDAFDGDVGLYVRDLTTGETLAFDANSVFPTASMIKVPILCALFDRIERGELGYHDELTYTKARLYPGEDLLGAFGDGETVSLDKVAMLMITTSDNTAALWCQELSGKGTSINSWLAANGFEQTRVNSRTERRSAAQKRYGWGQTTPREMAELLVRIRNGQAVSAAASDEMRRCLQRIYWDGEALASIPPGVATLSKQGAVSQSRSEVVLVHTPNGHEYVFCLITNSQQDTRWEHDNEGFVLLRDVSRILWSHFAPTEPYIAATERSRFQ
ncbi:MAG: serine hydrolase [Planctomycetota bacterium]